MASHRRGTHRAVDNDGVGRLRRPSGFAGTSLTLAALSLCTVIPTAVASINTTTLVHAFAVPATVQVSTQSPAASFGPSRAPTSEVGTASPGTSLAAPPSTDSGSLIARDVPVTGAPRTVVIDHPQSIGPIIASGPSTRAVLSTEFDDETKERAVQQNLAVMTVIAGLDADSPFVVYTGDPQASGGPGGTDGNTSLTPPPSTGGPVIVLVSDPRGPWSIRAWLETIPFVSALLRSLGRDGVPPRTERPHETPQTDVDTRGEPDTAEPPRGRPIEPNPDTRDTTSDAGTDVEASRDPVEPRQVDRETLPDIDVDSVEGTPDERENRATTDTDSQSDDEGDDRQPEESRDSESGDSAGHTGSESGDDGSASSDRSGSSGSGGESTDSTA